MEAATVGTASLLASPVAEPPTLIGQSAVNASLIAEAAKAAPDVWQAFIPDYVKVGDQWIADVTVFKGDDSFVVTVTHPGDDQACLSQVRSAISARAVTSDAPTLLGVVDLTPVVPVQSVPTPLTAQDQFYIVAARELAQLRFNSLSPKTQAMMTDASWIDGMPR